MTKRRQPLTFENALTRVAAVIGWADVARIVGQAENTVRNWSDPDTTAKMSLEAAFRLDKAFREAGGADAPFLFCYATRLEAEMLEFTADRQKLVEAAAIVAKESGEAVAATLAASGPNATHADFIIAEREIEEAIDAKKGLLATIRVAARQLMGGAVAATQEENDMRGPEVPPPVAN